MKFSSLAVGDTFDFIDDEVAPGMGTSFFSRCIKTSARQYCESRHGEAIGEAITVGSNSVEVFHVGETFDPKPDADDYVVIEPAAPYGKGRAVFRGTENECFGALLKLQSSSVDSALKDQGWRKLHASSVTSNLLAQAEKSMEKKIVLEPETTEALFLISGRIAGDDDDSCYLIVAENEGEAQLAFHHQICDDSDKEYDAENDRANDGAESLPIFVNISQMFGQLHKDGTAILQKSALVFATKTNQKNSDLTSDEGTHFLLSIENTAHAAFVDESPREEIARIIRSAGDKIAELSGLDEVDFPLRDINGNRVGKFERVDQLPKGDVAEGSVRLTITVKGAAFEDAACKEFSRILRTVADQVRDGFRDFAPRDINGNTVGKFEYVEESPSDDSELEP